MKNTHRDGMYTGGKMKNVNSPSPRKAFLRVGILAATAALAALACGLPGPAEPTATVPPSGIPAGWICYTDTTYGFEVCYPPDATINTASPEHSRIDLSITPDTTLLSKEMDVDAGEGWPTCDSPWGSTPGATQTIGSLEFLVQSGEEGTAGHLHRWTGYSTERDGVCVSLTGLLDSANPMVYSTPPPDYDLAAESAVLDQIVATFRWLEIEPPDLTPVPEGWLCYQNLTYNFEVCYPPDATLTGETADHVRINLTIVPDTNLLEKWMDVDGRYTPPDCGSPQASGYDPSAVDTSTQTIAGLEFLVQSAGEGAAGNIYHWTGYSTERTGVCASLTAVLHSGQAGNWSPPRPEFDEAAESAVFLQIVNTFRWLDAPTPTPPADDTPSATLKENTNCRRGASTDHEVITYLRQGMVVRIVGRNEDSSWWLVQYPGSALQCWIWAKFTITNGDLTRVPFVESPLLGCWYQGPRDKRPRCVAPCPDGAKPGGVCEP
jgi:hypothetical protein